MTQPFLLADAAGARARTARAEEDVLELSLASRGVEVAVDAGGAWIDLYVAEQSHVEAEREVQLAEELVSKVEQGRGHEAFTSADLADARAYLAEAKLAALALAGQVFDAGLGLAHAMRCEVPQALATRGTLPTAPEPSPLDVAAAGSRLPSALLAGAAHDAAVAKVRETEALAAPRLEAGLVASQDAPGDVAGFARASLTLPFFDTAAREKASLAAEAEVLRGEEQHALRAAEARVVAAHHEVEHTGELRDLVAGELVPVLEEQARLATVALALGDVTVLDVVRARRALFQARAKRVAADAAHARARFELALLVEPASALRALEKEQP